jgi:hypothetical protein
MHQQRGAPWWDIQLPLADEVRAKTEKARNKQFGWDTRTKYSQFLKNKEH